MDPGSERIFINRGWDYSGIAPPLDWKPWCFIDDGRGFCRTEQILTATPEKCKSCPKRCGKVY